MCGTEIKKVVLIELLSWWPNVECGPQTHGHIPEMKNYFDPSRHRTNELAALLSVAETR